MSSRPVRVTFADGITHSAVVRTNGQTVVVHPFGGTLEQGVTAARELLTEEERLYVWAAFGRTPCKGDPHWSDSLPEALCPCVIPRVLRLEPYPDCRRWWHQPDVRQA